MRQAEEERFLMIKIVIFDSGYGGELLADYLELELPVMDIIRVIDWRHAEQIQNHPKLARHLAEQALRPYLNKVDLIIFSNYLVSATSLHYFRRKYKNQSFLGIKLQHPATFKRTTHIFTTKALTKTLRYKKFVRQIKGQTVVLDDWPLLIDDGELGHGKIRRDLEVISKDKPTQIILACSQFAELKDELRRLYGQNLKLIDNFDEVLREVCHTLRIRGGLKKQK